MRDSQFVMFGHDDSQQHCDNVLLMYECVFIIMLVMFIIRGNDSCSWTDHLLMFTNVLS